MSYKLLFLKWTYKGELLIPPYIRLRIPDNDETIKGWLEAYIEQYVTIAQLDVDYSKMYIDYETDIVLPPPYSINQGDILIEFSFVKH
jgi:hypothetical protein